MSSTSNSAKIPGGRRQFLLFVKPFKALYYKERMV